MLATAEEVRTNLGYVTELAIDQPDGPRGGWGLNSASAQDAGVMRRLWMVSGSDEGVGGVSVLPGGAWAFDASFAQMSAATREHAVVTPIAGVDRASFDCQMEFGDNCRLNMVVGGNCLQMVASLKPGGGEAVLEAQMAAFAATIAAQAG